MREGDLLWEPRGPSKLADYIEERGFSSYDELWRWSVEDLEGFWGSIWERFEVGPPPERVLGPRRDAGRRVVPGHAAELRRAAASAGRARARRRSCTRPSRARWPSSPGTSSATRPPAVPPACGASAWAAATAWPRTCRTSPRRWSAFLACASIGAVWSSCAPEFGVPTVVDRFKQIEPRVLLATEGYRYGGKDFDRRDRVREIEAAIPSLEHTVLVPVGLGRAAGRAGRARLRATALRPPALGALFVGHDGAAEGDRAGPGRHPARAPEEGEPAQRPVRA